MPRKAVSKLKLFAFLVALICACGYSVSTLLPPHIKSIYIPTFENETTRYGIEQDLTTAVTDAFAHDNRLSVVSEAEADAMLRGVIRRYEKGALTFDRAQSVDEFRIEIVVSVELEDLKKGKILWREEEISAWTSYTEGSEAEGEEEALQKVITTLAQDILSRTVEGW